MADAILSVAPDAQLIACKVCTSDTGTCPGCAVIQALEYALDPNEDGNMDDKVDIVNLSLGKRQACGSYIFFSDRKRRLTNAYIYLHRCLGGSYLSSFYDIRTEALEKVFQLGVLPIVAAGNEGNIPYIGGKPLAVSVISWKRKASLTYCEYFFLFDRTRSQNTQCVIRCVYGEMGFRDKQ